MQLFYVDRFKVAGFKWATLVQVCTLKQDSITSSGCVIYGHGVAVHSNALLPS